MTLVPAKDEGVPRPELPALSGDHDLDAAPLAGQVLTRSGGVRNPDQVTSWCQLHARDVEAGNRFRKQRPELRALALSLAHLIGSGEPRRRPRRADQLFDRHLEGGGRAGEDGEGGIGGARFEARPGRARDARERGHPLLGEAAGFAQAAGVRREVGL